MRVGGGGYFSRKEIEMMSNMQSTYQLVERIQGIYFVDFLTHVSDIQSTSHNGTFFLPYFFIYKQIFIWRKKKILRFINIFTSNDIVAHIRNTHTQIDAEMESKHLIYAAKSFDLIWLEKSNMKLSNISLPS